MPRRPPLALAVLALLTGCGDGTVDVDPTTLTPAAQGVCTRVVDALPPSLAEGVTLREVSPDSGTTAAWGDPAVTFRCGVPEGSARDDPYEFDGVRWAMHDDGASRRWTTRGRAVNVEVVVPDHYSGQAEMLGRVAVALAPTAR